MVLLIILDIPFSGNYAVYCLMKLSGQSQRVAIDGSMSMEFSLHCGVPQGFCLGPLLFVIHTSSLFKNIERHLF